MSKIYTDFSQLSKGMFRKSAPVREIRAQGLLIPPPTKEVFPGEVREHILAVLSEGLEAAQSSERECRNRRGAILQGVWIG